MSKICGPDVLDRPFHDQLTNAEALAFYVYSTANGWHTYINEQLWSGSPNPDVAAFAKVLNSGLSKLVAISGRQATVYRGYRTDHLDAFSNRYVLGEVVTFSGFTSASFSQTGAFGGNVLFIIRALTARAIWWLSPNFHEEEALLPTGCSFRVVDKTMLVDEADDSTPVQLSIVLEELPQRA